jgi:hypothetical protein
MLCCFINLRMAEACCASVPFLATTIQESADMLDSA